MTDIEVTPEEQKAINALKRVAAKWPESLWLFSASGSLCVMKKRDGKRVFLSHSGVDPDYQIDDIDIENTGGDW